MKRSDLKVGEAYFYRNSRYSKPRKAVVLATERVARVFSGAEDSRHTFLLPNGKEGSIKYRSSEYDHGIVVAIDYEGGNWRCEVVPIMQLKDTWDHGYAEWQEQEDRARAANEKVREERRLARLRRERAQERLTERLGPDHVVRYDNTIDIATVEALLDRLDHYRERALLAEDEAVPSC